MTDPKKPLRRTARVKSVTACGAPPTLTDGELAILADYRAMDDDTREFAIEAMQILAKRNPRAPRLRLVDAPSS